MLSRNSILNSEVYISLIFAQLYLLLSLYTINKTSVTQRYQHADSRSGGRTDAKASKNSVEAEIKRTMKASKIQRDVVSVAILSIILKRERSISPSEFAI